jgi:hypothetical protein
MRNNAIAFEKYISEHKIQMNKAVNVDEFTIFTFPEKIVIDGIEKQVLGGGNERRAVLALRDDDTLVDIYCFHITSIPNSDKVRTLLYQLFNELNSTYKYLTFFENENVISAKICIPFNNNFDSELVFEMLAVIFQAVEQEYPKIMARIN